MAAGISAIGRGDAQRIVTVDVAQSAGNRCVTIRQREAGAGVIKNSRGPRRNRMAGSTLRSAGRKSGGNVIRNAAANRCGALKGC